METKPLLVLKSTSMLSKPENYYTIRPPHGFLSIDWREMWRYRELLYIFAWRDIKVRYKQTLLGVAWAIFQPFVTMVIFSFFFGKLAKIPSDGAPYPVFVYSGLIFWNYFSSSLTNASNSLIAEQNIIKKVYFPRLILPISATVTHVIDFFFALIVLVGIILFFKITPNILTILFIPLLLLISTIASSGVGLFLASINVKYRDVRYILPFFIQILLYVTPVIYPVSIIPNNFKWVVYLNPMSGVITTARALFLNNGAVDSVTIIISFIMSLVFLILGIFYFRKSEQFFADII
jgi:lipopolysaccharide transport system permease protein